MKLKSFGCSFIYGTDLHDEGGGYSWFAASNHTWPALIANNLGFDYACHARPGAGNLQIMERILTHAANAQGDFFVINWTWIDRFDHSGRSNDETDHWSTIMPGDIDPVARYYYRNIHSQYRDKITNLAQISLCMHLLKERNIPFIMTYMDELLFENQYHITPCVTDLQRQIRSSMKTLQGKNFLDWSRARGHDISPKMHPLESAHADAADYILENLDDFVTGSLSMPLSI